MTRVLTLVVLSTTLLAGAAPARAQTAAVADDELGRMAVRAIVSYTEFSIFDDVQVHVADRRITLTGYVTMPYKRDEMAKRVAAIPDVRQLTNEIKVLPASRVDRQLRVNVAQAIYTHPSFWQYSSMVNPPIHIIVERGRVRLTGSVSSQVDRMLAFALAQVDGALDVTNELRIDGR